METDAVKLNKQIQPVLEGLSYKVTFAWPLATNVTPIGLWESLIWVTMMTYHACVWAFSSSPCLPDLCNAYAVVSVVQVEKGHLNTLRDAKAALNKQLVLVSTLRQVGTETANRTVAKSLKDAAFSCLNQHH